MANNIKTFNIEVDQRLFDFVNNEILIELEIDRNFFWEKFSKLINKFNPLNKKLLDERDLLQKNIDDWHRERVGQEINFKEYKNFLFEIGYITDQGPDFNIDTLNTDPEISEISGPQLVVPITNSRYSLNAVNARWGSLYNAIYGTDVLGNLPSSDIYDHARGKKVIKYAKSYLDKILPLEKSIWENIVSIELINQSISFNFNDNKKINLNTISSFQGYILNQSQQIKELIFKKNNLHIRIIIDQQSDIGKKDPAGISDIIFESAVSTILDCEDSVATVDTEDKILAYKNWLGLMKGDLKSTFLKNGKTINRLLNDDIEFNTLNGDKIKLKGRSLMLIRNVGHLMTTSSILDHNREEVGEGLMDAMITSMIALHDFRKARNKNSICNSIYIVKPKMHGPDEVTFTVNLMSDVEEILNIPKNTIKLGIMDEERRTSINLKACIRAAKSRVAFINTGFLDRTGDEIHTSMFAGPCLRKGEMKNSKWIDAYEKRNVSIGLECGLMGKAQIGKGMWAMPDLMKEMLKQKINHPLSGANCAWVPSPTAATLHAMHYHEIDIKTLQNKLLKQENKDLLDDLITLPLLHGRNLSDKEISDEVENNVQGILGYVVRWVDQGVGCSKVPDINNIGLMEDRATCRISSQALANWLHHKIINIDQLNDTLNKMAKIVDQQNKTDPKYIPMSSNDNSLAFQAVRDLIFEGTTQPSGYTEPILHKRRLQFKSK